MDRLATLLCCAFSVSACSDKFINVAEKKVAISTSGNLKGLADEARSLSKEYVRAAGRTATTQDVFAFLTILAAGATVAGAAGSATDKVIANRAIAGVAFEQSASRLAPMTAIKAIYVGAKRLNCIATASSLGGETSLIGNPAALALTRGAIEEAKIMTREGLVRSVADYGTLFTEFDGASGGGNKLVEVKGIGGKMSLEGYQKILLSCLTVNRIDPATIPNGK